MGPQLLALCALLIGEEGEAAPVDILQQNDPRVRHAVSVDRRQGHGVGVVRLTRLGRLQPLGEQAIGLALLEQGLVRIGRQLRGVVLNRRAGRDQGLGHAQFSTPAFPLRHQP